MWAFLAVSWPGVLGRRISDGPGGAPKVSVLSGPWLSLGAGLVPQSAPFLGNTRVSLESLFSPALFRRVRVPVVDVNSDNRAASVLGARPTGRPAGKIGGQRMIAASTVGWVER
jgi:hypothetical protein